MSIFVAMREKFRCLISPYSEYVYKYRKTTRNRALVLVEYREATCDNVCQNVILR